jgi:hypothetical protein
MAGQPTPRTEHFIVIAKQPVSAQECSMEEAYNLGLMQGPSPASPLQKPRAGVPERDTCRGEAPGLAGVD